MNALLRSLVAVALSGALGACALFSTTPDAKIVSDVHRAVQPGMSIEAVRTALADLGFACEARRGAYTDESGTSHEDQRFLQCTRRPGAISMACANRDQVVVVPDAGGPVRVVAVSRGPHCAQ